jgi:hypothetical protein
MLAGNLNLSGVRVAVAPLDATAVALPVDRAIAGLNWSRVVPLIEIAVAAIADEAV